MWGRGDEGEGGLGEEVVSCTIDDTTQVGEWSLVVVVPARMGYYLTQIFVTRFLLL